MKLYRQKIEPIADDIVRVLTETGDIDISGENRPVVLEEVRVLLDAYVVTEYEVAQDAKDIIQQERGLRYDQFGKIRRILATDRDLETGTEGIEWLVERLIENLLSDERVDEVYADDPTLRRAIFDIFRKHLEIEAQLDEEVRGRIRNLRETDPAYPIEYERVMREVRRKHGLL